MSTQNHAKSDQTEPSTTSPNHAKARNESNHSNPSNPSIHSHFSFTRLDPEELAAKVVALLFPKLEQRLRKLETRFRELEQKQASLEQIRQQEELTRYLRPLEVKRRYGIGRDLLGDLVAMGHIKRYDAGTHGRYRTDELEKYLKRYHADGKRRDKLKTNGRRR